MSTTIGTYPGGRGWTAVSVLEAAGEQLLVDEHHAHPDDPHAREVIVRRYRERERALAEGAARVLALGGQLGAEPGQLAGSPVQGQARAQLRPAPRIAAWLELDGRDSTRVERGRAELMFGSELERYLHVVGAALTR
jgi:hypothetical protein